MPDHFVAINLARIDLRLPSVVLGPRFIRQHRLGRKRFKALLCNKVVGPPPGKHDLIRFFPDRPGKADHGAIGPHRRDAATAQIAASHVARVELDNAITIRQPTDTNGRNLGVQLDRGRAFDTRRGEVAVLLPVLPRGAYGELPKVPCSDKDRPAR